MVELTVAWNSLPLLFQGWSNEALAVCASFVLSSVSIIPMFVLPRIPTRIHAPLMHMLLATSCGSLLANAFLHILPEVLLQIVG